MLLGLPYVCRQSTINSRDETGLFQIRPCLRILGYPAIDFQFFTK
jgi:hypothetical protein